jgi:hypothetical protein
MLRQPVTKRRWIQWSLRGFLLAILAFAVGFAWYGARLRREARINNAVRLIAASPGWFHADQYDPIALIRAVNTLHTIGKDDALEALTRFAKNNPSHGPPDEPHERMRLIIPLLFGRVDPEDRLPSLFASDLSGTRYRLENREWYTDYFVTVVRDIPFHRSQGIGFAGAMEDFSYAIDWAKRYARFRTTPLRPADSPFDAADRLILELKWEADRPGGRPEQVDGVRRHIREQVAKCVAHLLPPDEADKYLYWRNWDINRGLVGEDYRDLHRDDNWAALRQACEALNIQWSAQRQAYVATKR